MLCLIRCYICRILVLSSILSLIWLRLINLRRRVWCLIRIRSWIGLECLILRQSFINLSALIAWWNSCICSIVRNCNIGIVAGLVFRLRLITWDILHLCLILSRVACGQVLSYIWTCSILSTIWYSWVWRRVANCSCIWCLIICCYILGCICGSLIMCIIARSLILSRIAWCSVWGLICTSRIISLISCSNILSLICTCNILSRII